MNFAKSFTNLAVLGFEIESAYFAFQLSLLSKNLFLLPLDRIS